MWSRGLIILGTSHFKGITQCKALAEKILKFFFPLGTMVEQSEMSTKACISLFITAYHLPRRNSTGEAAL
jgi:L-alanine-DL-glutamate epimerase-like enolase superfamily enzyme